MTVSKRTKNQDAKNQRIKTKERKQKNILKIFYTLLRKFQRFRNIGSL